MGPAGAITSSLRNTFRLGEPAGRTEFWWAFPVYFVLSRMIIMVHGLPTLGDTFRTVAAVGVWALAVPAISVGTRRLKDAGVWRWWFISSILFGVAVNVFYRMKPSRAELQFWQVKNERADIEPWLNGYEIHNIFQAAASAIPWIGGTLVLLCLLLALLPSRHDNPATSEVTP